MKAFRKILKFELKNYLTNKVYLVLTVLLVLLIAVVMFFPRIAGAFKGGEEKPDDRENLPAMLLVGEENWEETTRPMLVDSFAAAFPEYRIVPLADLERAKETLLAGEAECAVALESPESYTYYVNNLSLYDSNIEFVDAVLSQLTRVSAMITAGMTPEEAEEALVGRVVTGNTVSLGKNQAENFFYTYIMIFALYMVIILYGQMVATGVATEKSSRAMELLITSAGTNSLMFGKVIAACLAGLIQIVAVFGSALLFYRLNLSAWGDNFLVQSIFAMPVNLFLYMLVFFVLGFFIYALLYGAVGSMASRLEDINTSSTPITMLFIIGFFVVVFSMTSGDTESLLLKVCSFIPFTSPMAMFTRIAMSTVPWVEIALSILILLASVVGVGVVSAKIYRVGVLLYGTPPKLGKMLKAVLRTK